MENWRRVWREGFAPLLSTKALLTLRKALSTNDPRLIQGATTIPPPLQCVQNWPVEAACVIGYCGWQGENLDTIAKVEEYFYQTCRIVDKVLNEPAVVRHFLNWFDETPREEVRVQLLEEVNFVLMEQVTY